MTTLYIRNFPERLYRHIQGLAEAQRRSIGAQVTVLINQAVQQENSRTRGLKALEKIARRRRRLRSSIDTANTLSMLREDRAR
jgi:hypothetical protein